MNLFNEQNNRKKLIVFLSTQNRFSLVQSSNSASQWCQLRHRRWRYLGPRIGLRSIGSRELAKQFRLYCPVRRHSSVEFALRIEYLFSFLDCLSESGDPLLGRQLHSWRPHSRLHADVDDVPRFGIGRFFDRARARVHQPTIPEHHSASWHHNSQIFATLLGIPRAFSLIQLVPVFFAVIIKAL